MEPARGDCGISSNARQGFHFECAVSSSNGFSSFAIGCSRFYSNFGRRSAAAREATCGVSGIGERQSQHRLQVSSIPAIFKSRISWPIRLPGSRLKRRVIDQAN
jgi:hypothetical protein